MKIVHLKKRVDRAGWVLLSLWLTIAGVLVSCDRQEDAQGAASSSAQEARPKLPVVVAEGGDYVLRYFSPTSGKLIVVHKVSEVPEGARGQVIVVPDDPKMRGPWLFVADLSSAEGAHYKVRIVDRFSLERRVAQVHPQAPSSASLGGASLKDVVLYRTSWCGYCEKAEEYLRLKKVPFSARDLEKDPGARRDMLARAAKAGVPASSLQGVPIIAIGDHILSGFNREAIDAALAEP